VDENTGRSQRRSSMHRFGIQISAKNTNFNILLLGADVYASVTRNEFIEDAELT